MGIGNPVLWNGMKIIHLIILATSILGSSQLLASEDESGFPDIETLEAFARSSWGGGEIELLENGDDQLAIIRRQFTSGVDSCILSIYTKQKQGWFRAIETNPVSNGYMSFEQDGDTVRFFDTDSNAEVFRVSISNLSTWNSK